jgi:hypothetical protein
MTDKTTPPLTNCPPIYAEVGANYRAIDDLRLRLMALLPLATGTGVFLLLKPEGASPNLAVEAGLFGIVATVSLFFYELHGIEKCAHYIHRGQQLEKVLKVRGSFTSRPHEIFGVVSELLPAGLIYPASLAGWAYVTAAGWTGKLGGGRVSFFAALATLVLGIVVALGLIRKREKARKKEWEAEDRDYECGKWPESAVGSSRNR